MNYAYSNNGDSWRMVEADWILDAGEVAFDHQPTDAALTAAFPGYAAAASAAVAQAKYATASAAGCQIVSASAPALNGTYGVQPSDLLMVSGEQVYILARQTFSNGQTSRGWEDVVGTYHMLPSIAEGEALFSALAGYVDALKTALALAQGGGTWVAPVQPVTIL